jgi:hypothetical protein
MKRIILALLFMHRIFSMQPDQPAVPDAKVLNEFLEFLEAEQRINDAHDTTQNYSGLYAKNFPLLSKTHNITCTFLECNQTFANGSEYRKHLALHDPLECFACEKQYRSEQGYRIHLKRIHGINLKIHKRINYSQIKSLRSDLLLEKPLKNAESTEPTKKDPLELIQEKRLPLGELFRCDKCPNAYTSKSAFLLHYQRDHGPKIYACDFCDAEPYAVNGDLQQHIRRKHKDLLLRYTFSYKK